MLGLRVRRGRLLAVGALAVMGATLAVPLDAEARRQRRIPFSQRNAQRATCPPAKDLVRVDEKVCPPNPRRGEVVLERACCENFAGKVKCRKFLKCPKNSPS